MNLEKKNLEIRSESETFKFNNLMFNLSDINAPPQDLRLVLAPGRLNVV